MRACPYYGMEEQPGVCRYRRIIDQKGNCTPWYPKSHNTLLTKILDYISTQAAAVVLVVSALPTGTTATACYEDTKRQATALRRLLPSRTPLLLAVTRIDLVNSELNPVEAASASKAEKQQLLQGYKDLAGLLGLLYVEVDGTSSSSVQQLWQKVAAVAADDVNGVCSSNGVRSEATAGSSSSCRRADTAAAAGSGGGGQYSAPDGGCALTPGFVDRPPAGTDGELCSNSTRGRTRGSSLRRYGAFQAGWTAAIRAAMTTAAAAVVGGSGSSSRRGGLSQQRTEAAGTSSTSDQGGTSDSNHRMTAISSSITSGGSSSSDYKTGPVGKQQQLKQQLPVVSCTPSGLDPLVPGVKERVDDHDQLLYDACGALPADYLSGGTMKRKGLCSENAVREMAGWVVLRLDANMREISGYELEAGAKGSVMGIMRWKGLLG